MVRSKPTEHEIIQTVNNLISNYIKENKNANLSEIRKYIKSNVVCTTRQLSKVIHTYYKEFAEIDLLDTKVQDKIMELYDTYYDNIPYIAEKLYTTKLTINSYINNWIKNNNSLSAEHEKIFKQHYESYVTKNISASKFSELMFGSRYHIQIIYLYMKKHNLISCAHYNRFKSAAHERKIDFNVSPNYINYIYNLQNGKSVFSDKPLKSYYRNHDYGDITIYSIDRIDSSRPYVEGNIQLVTKFENIMKNSLTQSEFDEYISSIFSVIYKKEYGEDKTYLNIKKILDKLIFKNQETILNLRDVEYYDNTNKTLSLIDENDRFY